MWIVELNNTRVLKQATCRTHPWSQGVFIFVLCSSVPAIPCIFVCGLPFQFFELCLPIRFILLLYRFIWTALPSLKVSLSDYPWAFVRSLLQVNHWVAKVLGPALGPWKFAQIFRILINEADFCGFDIQDSYKCGWFLWFWMKWKCFNIYWVDFHELWWSFHFSFCTMIRLYFTSVYDKKTKKWGGHLSQWDFVFSLNSQMLAC